MMCSTHLLGMPFAKATFAEAKGINEPGVDFFAPQRAETCYFTSVERAYCFPARAARAQQG